MTCTSLHHSPPVLQASSMLPPLVLPAPNMFPPLALPALSMFPHPVFQALSMFPSSSTKHANSVSDKTVELPAPLSSSFSASTTTTTAKTTDPHIDVACWVTTVDETTEVALP